MLIQPVAVSASRHNNFFLWWWLMQSWMQECINKADEKSCCMRREFHDFFMKLQLKGRRYQHKSCVFSALSPLSDGKCTRHVARLASLKRFRRWWRFMLIFRVHWIKVFATQLNFSLMANSGSTIDVMQRKQSSKPVSFDAIKWQICIILQFTPSHFKTVTKSSFVLFGKSFHIRAQLDADHITRTCHIVAQKWKFNVFVTTGRVFRIALPFWCCSLACFIFFLLVRDIFAAITIGNKFYKNTFFLVAILRTGRCEREKHFTIQTCLAITCSCAALERCFNNAIYRAPFFHRRASPISYDAMTDRWWIEKWLSHKCLWMK